MKRIVFIFCLLLSNISIAQKVAIENTMQRVFYQWMENPLKIVVENVPCNKIVVKVDKGRIEGSACEYKYFAEDTTIDRVTISVGVKQNNKIKWIVNEISPVKRYIIFDPRFACRRNYDSTFKELFYTTNEIFNPEITFICEDFIIVGDGPDQCKLTSYSIQVIRNGAIVYQEANVQGSQLTKSARDFFETNSKRGDKVVFNDMNCLIYLNEKRKIDESLVYFIK